MAQLTAHEKKHLVRFKLVEGVREVGVLWIALAPLDYAISSKISLRDLGLWLGFGLFLLVAAPIVERRIHDAD